MKFILTGVTGFIGSEVLSQCLRHPKITSIIALSRRELPNTIGDGGKLRVIVIENFEVYPESVVEELKGADACIWCMGNTLGNRALEVDYPLAFTSTLSSTLHSTAHPFRYIHLSGAATERNQSASLWFKSEMRKMKGETENHVLSLPKINGLWSSLVVKSGFVVNKRVEGPRDVMGWMMGGKSIGVDVLAAVMISAAVEGWGKEASETWDDCGVMNEMGRAALEKLG